MIRNWVDNFFGKKKDDEKKNWTEEKTYFFIDWIVFHYDIFAGRDKACLVSTEINLHYSIFGIVKVTLVPQSSNITFTSSVFTSNFISPEALKVASLSSIICVPRDL